MVCWFSIFRLRISDDIGVWKKGVDLGIWRKWVCDLKYSGERGVCDLGTFRLRGFDLGFIQVKMF